MKLDRSLLDWLLEPNEPAVQYHVLAELLDRSLDDPRVRVAYSKIPKRGWAFEILKEQKRAGNWESLNDVYRPEYSATFWKLIVLADLGLTVNDSRIRKAAELLIDRLFQPEDGGFRIPDSTSQKSELCVTGNLVTALCRIGMGEDWRVRSAFKWFVDTQMEDGGWHCSPEIAFGRGTLDCWEALSSFAALKKTSWTRTMKRSVEKGADFYLDRELFRQGSARYEPWFRFHYPVHYYYDLLVGLDVITSLGYAGDKRLRAPLEILRQKRRSDGTWTLDAIHPDLTLEKTTGGVPKGKVVPFALETAGAKSKWITFVALRVLKRVEESEKR